MIDVRFAWSCRRRIVLSTRYGRIYFGLRALSKRRHADVFLWQHILPQIRGNSSVTLSAIPFPSHLYHLFIAGDSLLAMLMSSGSCGLVQYCGSCHWSIDPARSVVVRIGKERNDGQDRKLGTPCELLLSQSFRLYPRSFCS